MSAGAYNKGTESNGNRARGMCLRPLRIWLLNRVSAGGRGSLGRRVLRVGARSIGHVRGGAGCACSTSVQLGIWDGAMPVVSTDTEDQKGDEPAQDWGRYKKKDGRRKGGDYVRAIQLMNENAVIAMAELQIVLPAAGCEGE